MNPSVPTHDQLQQMPLALLRQSIRSGQWSGHTSGLAAGRVQANLCILPADLATDFLLFCQRNPKPCPLLAVSEPGDFTVKALGQTIDLRTDLPRYRVWKDGHLHSEPTSLVDLWRSDLVSFVIGCSFSFEEALIENGIALRHVSMQKNVAMYRTNIPTVSAGPFSGPMVVSMRPLKASDAIRAVQITSRYPNVHGAPVHIGDPSQIGIRDLNTPDYGDAIPIEPNEIPVFWACGVTPQAVVAASKPSFCITHAPGAMLITDLMNAQLASH